LLEKFHHGFTISHKFLLLSYNIINNLFRIKSHEWNFIWTTDGNEDFNFNDLFSFATLLKKYWKKGLNGLNYLLLGFIWIFLLQSFCLHKTIWMDNKDLITSEARLATISNSTLYLFSSIQLFSPLVDSLIVQYQIRPSCCCFLFLNNCVKKYYLYW